MTLQEVLHAHVPTLRPDACIRDAVDRMDLYQFHAIAVVDEDRKPVAMVTESDLVESLRGEEDLVGWSRCSVVERASRPPSLAEPTDDAMDTLRRMLAEGCEMLAVVHGSRLAGVVSRIDLMQALVSELDQGDWPSQERIG